LDTAHTRSSFPRAAQVGLPALLLFVASGTAALVYEIVWFQLLELFIGSSAVSIGVLLATFMGGMCVGSVALAKVVGPRRHPLRVYAVLELGIGACGLMLLFVMPAIGRMYTAWGGDGLTGFLLRGLVAAMCLLPPTIAMGATLPAVARLVKASPDGMASLGLFYAGNIAGGVFGSLLAGFYLLRLYDMRTATYVAVIVNATAALTAWRFASAGDASYGLTEPEPRQGVRGGDDARALFVRLVPYAAIACSGFCALAGEVVWTRLLALLFGATVYTFSIILAVFLIGLGIGSAVGAPLAARARPARAFGWCQLLAAAAVGWTAYELSASLPYWPINPSLSPSIWLNFRLDFVRALWAVLPPALLWGASFPLALASVASIDEDPGRLVGRVYAANTAGAVAGALSASLLFVAWIGTARTEQVMMFISVLAGLAGLGADLAGRQPAVRAARSSAAAMAVVLAIIAVAWLGSRVPPVPGLLVAHGRYAATFLNQDVNVIYVGEGLQSSVAVSRFPDGKLGYHNAGKIQASSAPEDMRLQRLLGHLTTLVPASPRSVLVIGCGAGVTAGAVSINPMVERVTIAEIEPLVPRVVSTYFGAQNYDVVRNPKVQIRIDDARHYLLTSRETFDAITSDPLDPWVKGAATLYTKEFFEAARAHLNPGGVVTLFVQLYDSSPEAVKSEIATFFQVFPEGIIAGNTFRGVGYDTVLLGQAGPTRIDLDGVEARLQRPDFAPVVRSLKEIGLASVVDLFGTYAGRAADLSEWMKTASINRDADLRLQYLAGLGLNMNESDEVYAEILKYRRFPEELFTGSPRLMEPLRERISTDQR
jgi:spermidine synthase